MTWACTCVCVCVWASVRLWQSDIGLGVRVFANGPGDLGSIPGRVIPKTQKMVLDASLLNTQHYKVRIKGKEEQFREGVAPSPTPWCSSYRKGSLRVTLDYGRQLTTIYTYTPLPPVGLRSLANEVIALPLAFVARLFIYIWIELSVAVKRMYVNKSNCDS